MDITGKVAIIGDTHFARKVDNKLMKSLIDKGQLDYFNYLASFLKEQGVKTIMFTGDIHDTRNSIDVESLVNTKRIFQDVLSEFQIHIITGNHDMYYENNYDIISLELFSDIDNVNLYLKEFTQLNVNGYEWYMIPWLTDDRFKEFSEFTSSLKSDNKKVLFGHFEMLGIDMEGGNISKHGLDKSMYTQNVDYIFSGHYHGKSITKDGDVTINYVGSPYPLTFTNADQDHGIWIVDEEFNVEFHRNNISPEFTTIVDTEDISSIETLENKFVKLYMLNTASQSDKFNLLEKVKSMNPLHISRVYYKSDESNVSVSQDDVNEAIRKTNLSLAGLFEESIHKRLDKYPRLETVKDVPKKIVSTITSYSEELKL